MAKSPVPTLEDLRKLNARIAATDAMIQSLRGEKARIEAHIENAGRFLADLESLRSRMLDARAKALIQTADPEVLDRILADIDSQLPDEERELQEPERYDEYSMA